MYYPQYSYTEAAKYSPHPLHLIDAPRYHQVPVDDQLNLKVQLRARLNSGRLLNMPGGFPFHRTFTGHGPGRTSYDSYQFTEEFRTSVYNESLRSHCATITYTSPNTSSRTSTRQRGRYLTWRALIPELDMRTYSHREPPQLQVAQVQVDPTVMDTPYGQRIKKEAKIILCALSISLEFGLPITIRVADAYTASLRRSRDDSFSYGTIVYVGTRNDGSEEVICTANSP